MRYCFLLGLLAASVASADTLETRDGKRLSGKGAFGADVIELTTAETTHRIPLADVTTFIRDTSATPSRTAEGFTGLMAEYFSDTEWKTSSAITLVKGSVFDWGHDAPNPSTPALFSVRLTGSVLIPRRGNYQFRADGFSSLIVDGKVLGKDAAADAKGIALEAGQRVSIQMDFRKQKGVHGRANVRWFSESMDDQAIPAENFRTPDAFVTRLEAFHRQQLPGSRGGLKGEYFSDRDFKNRVMVRLDPGLGMNWQNSATVNPAFTDGFSARWTGRLHAPRSGTFRFQTTAQMRFWLNGKLLVDGLSPPAKNDSPPPVMFEMKEGQAYDVKIEAVRGKGWGAVRLASTLEADWGPQLSAKLLSPPEDMPRTRILLPLEKANVDAADGLRVRVAATPGGSPIRRVEIVANSGKDVIGESTIAPYDITLRPKDAGEWVIQSRVTNNDGLVSLSEPVTFSVDNPAEKLGKSAWSAGRVGTADAATAKFEQDKIIVTAGAGSIGDRSNLPLVTQLAGGDCEIVVRMAELKADNPHVVPTGGITLRRGMGTEAPHMSLTATDKRGWYITSAFRSSETSSYSEREFHAPVWFRLSRTGPAATAYWSENGTEWNQLGSLTLGDDQPLVAGLTAFGMADGGHVHAVFDNVSVRFTDEARLADGPGVQLVNGSIVYGAVRVQADRITVRGKDGVETQFSREEVARIFYAAVTATQVAELAPGWRGAIVNNDRMEGELSEVSSDEATVTSVIFGPQPLRPANGLAMVALADVKTAADATVIRHARGRTVATRVRLEGGKLAVHDEVLGDLTLELAEIASVRRSR